MMQEKHHVIAHLVSAVTKSEFPLSDEEAEHHLGYLESDIELYFSEKDIDVFVQIVGKRAHIKLVTDSNLINLDDELGCCLLEINERTSGLAFVKVD
jgi:hypothetical protein